LLATTWGLLAAVCRRVQADPPPAPGTTLARAYPELFVRFALLFLAVFVATNKVFSAQYVLWLVPFACLLPGRGWADRLALVLFVALCGVNTLFFPVYFASDVLG